MLVLEYMAGAVLHHQKWKPSPQDPCGNMAANARHSGKLEVNILQRFRQM